MPSTETKSKALYPANPDPKQGTVDSQKTLASTTYPFSSVFRSETHKQPLLAHLFREQPYLAHLFHEKPHLAHLFHRHPQSYRSHPAGHAHKSKKLPTRSSSSALTMIPATVPALTMTMTTIRVSEAPFCNRRHLLLAGLGAAKPHRHHQLFHRSAEAHQRAARRRMRISGEATVIWQVWIGQRIRFARPRWRRNGVCARFSSRRRQRQSS